MQSQRLASLQRIARLISAENSPDVGKKNWTPNYLSNPFMKLWKYETLFYKSGLQAVMWAYKDACTGLIYNTDWQGERDLPRNKTQDNKKDFTHLIFIYSPILWTGWLIFRVKEGLGAYPSMHWVKGREIPWTELPSITERSKTQTNSITPKGILESWNWHNGRNNMQPPQITQ